MLLPLAPVVRRTKCKRNGEMPIDQMLKVIYEVSIRESSVRIMKT